MQGSHRRYGRGGDQRPQPEGRARGRAAGGRPGAAPAVSASRSAAMIARRFVYFTALMVCSFTYHSLREQAVADRARRSFEEEERRWVFLRIDLYTEFSLNHHCRYGVHCCDCYLFSIAGFLACKQCATCSRCSQRALPLPSQSHFAHCPLQAAAAAVAKGSASVDDLLDTVTVLRLECVPECAPILLYLRFK
jgi:hypothetical protein